jgi:hypothetical protein
VIALNLKARVFLLHVVAVGLILAAAAVGANWAFSRMVLGQFDQSLLELAQTEAAAALANPSQVPRVHEMAPGRRRRRSPAWTSSSRSSISTATSSPAAPTSARPTCPPRPGCSPGCGRANASSRP